MMLSLLTGAYVNDRPSTESQLNSDLAEVEREMTADEHRAAMRRLLAVAGKVAPLVATQLIAAAQVHAEAAKSAPTVRLKTLADVDSL